MPTLSTDYGQVFIAPKHELFAQAVALATAAWHAPRTPHFTWAFTGGSTPQEWYRWAVDTQAIPAELLAHAHFTVSDERHVLLSSDQSNFGNAERQLLNPLDVPVAHRHPWMVAYPPEQAAEAYRRTWLLLGGPFRTYDVCFLGLGDDAHTASFFPGSPLLSSASPLHFAAVDVPGKGWRLTITPAGLQACGRIVIMTLGAGKAEALRRVLQEPYAPLQYPAQILRACAERVTWLVDDAAASRLG